LLGRFDIARVGLVRRSNNNHVQECSACRSTPLLLVHLVQSVVLVTRLSHLSRRWIETYVRPDIGISSTNYTRSLILSFCKLLPERQIFGNNSLQIEFVN